MKRVDQAHRPCLEIAVAGLADGDYPFRFEVAPDILGLSPDPFTHPVRVTGLLRRVSTQLTLRATIETKRLRTCDRCLSEDNVNVELPMDIYYREHAGRGGEEDVAEMYRELDPKQESIVLDEDVRTNLLVNLPLKNLCHEDCRGLCPTCGADLNAEECHCDGARFDPRWEKLAGLLGGMDTSERN